MTSAEQQRRRRPTDTAKWEQIKDEIAQTDHGGIPGQWTPEKARIAEELYERSGGGYADE
jgi:hypothetical protein